MVNKNPYDKLYEQIDFVKKPFGYNPEYLLWRTAKLKKELAKFITKDGRMLDVGGGTGIMVQFLPDFVNRDNYYNLDVSIKMLKYSRYQNILASAEAIPFSDSSFDYVISSDVLEHVNDKINALTECYRVLKQGGLFLLSTPRSGWRRDFVASAFLPFMIIYAVLRKLRRKKPAFDMPHGVKDEPSDEIWLKKSLERLGFLLLEQHRADNHVPWGNAGESKFWRWFADRFVNPRKYGHCTIIICRK